MFRLALLVSVIICALTAVPAHAVAWDFEDGTLQGWTLVSGDVGPQPVNVDDDRYGGNFNKQGKYFIGTYENTKDDAVAEFRSPDFTISANTISLLVGGGGHHDATYVALIVDGAEVYRETGRNAESMQRRYWDVSGLRGKTAHILVVDRHRGGWGHINVDDIRELTPQDEARLEAERRQRELNNQRWLENLMKPDGRKVYSGRELTDLAMPLGGIGAGNIAVCGNGALREWQIFNQVNSACSPLLGFFAIRTQRGSDVVARVLQTAPVEDLPCIAATEFIGEFPIAEVVYKDSKLPVNVRMEAFSPFIPMNAKDSGIPGIVFTFRVKNPGVLPVSVSLAGSLQNAVGYDGRSPINRTRAKGYGGNINTVSQGTGYTALQMTNPTLAPDHKHYGTMTLAALAPNVAPCAQWDLVGTFWNNWSRTGRFMSVQYSGPNPIKDSTWNGSLAVPFELKAGEEKSVTFLVTWSFPNLYADYQQHRAHHRLGHQYSNWFKDSAAAADYLASNLGRLSKETRLFRDTFFDSTLPYWLVQRIGAPVSTLTSQTMLWIEDGGLHGFEGSGGHGCCPMNCTHVYNYEMAMAFLFPELERNMRDTDLTVQLKEDGGVRHRTALPFSAPRETEPFVDGQLGTILKSHREFTMSADRAWFDRRWPAIKRTMEFVIRDWDPNRDGVLVNEQWNTYDAAMYGPNTFIGTMYLAALRAANEMAEVAGDSESAAAYLALAESGSRLLDSVLWNGEYYIHIDARDKATADWITRDWPANENAGANRPYGTGCHADQMLGQWWANILGLGYLLPRERVATTLDSIMKHNWRWDFADVPQQRIYALKGDMGLLNCTWPRGGRPAQMTLYSDEAWTGIEYEVAGLLLHEGKIKDAYMVARAVHDRYNGVPNPPFKRNPWNEIECGEHYARGMSSWSMLTAAQGFTIRGPQGRIGFDPRLTPENHRSFFTVPEGWGTFEQKRTASSQTDALRLAYGQFALKRIELTLPEGVTAKTVKAVLGGLPLRPLFTQKGTRLTLSILTEPAVLAPDRPFTVEIGW